MGAQSALEGGELGGLGELLSLPVSRIGLHLDRCHSLFQNVLVMVDQVLLGLPAAVVPQHLQEWNHTADQPDETGTSEEFCREANKSAKTETCANNWQVVSKESIRLGLGRGLEYNQVVPIE